MISTVEPDYRQEILDAGYGIIADAGAAVLVISAGKPSRARRYRSIKEAHADLIKEQKK